MSNITGKSIATLILFVLSIIFVIHDVNFPVKLPRYGKRTIPINLTTAPILAIAILWASQCLGPAQIRDGIVGTEGVKPYNILILFFSLAYMAITLDVTGILQSAAYWVSNRGGASGWRLFTYFYIMLTLLSVLLGNDPVILSGTAFLVYYTHVVEELTDPLPWLISEFAAANTASMVLFVGNPTNVVVCEGFGVNNVAFTAYTILPFLACNLFCFFALAIQYRSSKYIPRRITPTKLDVRSVLLDPVSAWVGSILLGSCLIVIIIVSFFGVDVWKISLPFAVAKFIWDMGWGHYQYLRRRNKVKSMQDSPVLDMSSSMRSDATTRRDTVESSPDTEKTLVDNHPPSPMGLTRLERLHEHFPTFFTALPRLPFALIPFAFSQFILIEALAHQGWIQVFAGWLVRASHREIHPTIWLIGVMGVILCNIAGTNIGATILLTKVVRAAEMPPHSLRAAAISLAVASNIGAVSFTFSASLAGLLWKTILGQKGINIRQFTFAKWNVFPLLSMTTVGLAIVSAEMAVLYHGSDSLE
ncbi:hypothetical protein Clacol_002962 [Clathrus columnatus]|uniref:Citrate transporter-like domain-containing protein n=1 Tax=Clathrus columnatus TaxID=1419009 RepID=A0AAV5A7X2_9AGAM|nr:hypothetical protein Clacol_002962 [Clathrus columnatus]